MKIPIFSLYSFSISLIAMTYLILTVIKIINQSKSDESLIKLKNEPLDKLQINYKVAMVSKFDLKILKILKNANELKIFFVNQGEKLYNLKCQGISTYQVILELESVDLNLDTNEPGVILIKDTTSNLLEVELLFEYVTDQKENRMKRVSINTVTKEITFM